MINRRTTIAGLLSLPVAARAQTSGYLKIMKEPQPKLVLTGDLGNVASRLDWVRKEYDWTGIDKKRGHKEDLGDWGPWFGQFSSADVVMHLAANPSAGAPLDDILHNNIVASGNVIRAAIMTNAPHVVFTSSVWADPVHYGHVGDNANWYSASKIVTEQLLRTYHDKTGSSVTIIRLGWVPPLGTPDDVKIAEWPKDIRTEENEIEPLFRLALEPKGFSIIDHFAVR